MECHINDLSLNGQFSSITDFRTAIESLLQLRLREPQLQHRLFCSRLLYTRKVTKLYDFRQAVLATNDRNFIRSVLEWTTKAGPFWEDNRQHILNDYFVYQTENVTDQGLGEAARRKIVDINASVFSFQGSQFDFTLSPLTVIWGKPRKHTTNILVDNYWELLSLTAFLHEFHRPTNWPDVYTEIVHRYSNLRFSNDVINRLIPTPFSNHVRDRIFELLRILDNIITESDENGKLTNSGHELLNNFFIGKKALFTDESTRNKRNFKHDMTFRDPTDSTRTLFCPWHGKIKSPQIRIHFEWPRPAGQSLIKVVYIGPKITKE